jgi:hypothetical protein
VIGTVGGPALDLGAVTVSLDEAAHAYEHSLPSHLSATVAAL